ncbi:MAG: hypothetical protein QM760_22410 [Nibricoccus sp.]
MPIRPPASPQPAASPRSATHAPTHAALLSGRIALQPTPVLGRDGGDLVPLALCPGRPFDESAPPNWLDCLRPLAATIPGNDWGGPRHPVFVTSSNFGVGSLYAFRRTGDTAHLRYGTPCVCVDWLRDQFGWGPNLTTFSHACVSAHLGLLQAARMLHAGLADEALVFSFDFLSPFVAGGFHALKILNAGFPAPYQDRPSGSIGLGDGAGFAVLTRDHGDFAILGQSLHNEMHHFTANQADGAGFEACLSGLAPLARNRRLWIKGHGTGTLDAGRLEAAALAKQFPDAPLVSWKGSLGHTLGSCGIVELSLAVESLRTGHTPGTVGASAPGFSQNVSFSGFDNADFETVLCASNAFGGAHAALLLAKSSTLNEPAHAPAASPSSFESAKRPTPATCDLFIQALRTDDAGAEEPAATRERLKEIFPKLSSRRMTQLGLVVGGTLLPLAPAETDALVYASEYAETRALEGYLDSFPSASPTLFQTSIHPSAVQQALIGRQQPVREFLPVTGRDRLAVLALQSAWLSGAPRMLLCGGEERGTWFLNNRNASDRTFGFTLALTREATPDTIGRIRLTPALPANGPGAINPSTSDPAALSLVDFFDALHQRRPLDLNAAPGTRLVLAWS